jgi:hypothetical protein
MTHRKTHCSSGQILRKAYSRKAYTKNDGTKVRSSKSPAVCIKDVGKPGKGKRLFVLRKGTLSKYGYSTKISKESRHAALRKAVEDGSRLVAIRKLNALAILNKNAHPARYQILRSDMKYVQGL